MLRGNYKYTILKLNYLHFLNNYFLAVKGYIHFPLLFPDTPTAKARWVLIYIHFQIYSKAYESNEQSRGFCIFLKKILYHLRDKICDKIKKPLFQSEKVDLVIPVAFTTSASFNPFSSLNLQ